MINLKGLRSSKIIDQSGLSLNSNSISLLGYNSDLRSALGSGLRSICIFFYIPFKFDLRFLMQTTITITPIITK